jgi:hypothetical protein
MIELDFRNVDFYGGRKKTSREYKKGRKEETADREEETASS